MARQSHRDKTFSANFLDLEKGETDTILVDYFMTKGSGGGEGGSPGFIEVSSCFGWNQAQNVKFLYGFFRVKTFNAVDEFFVIKPVP